MNEGIYIAFEGGEGAGKTVQMKRLMDRLKQMEREYVQVREPGGTVIGEKIRQVVLDPANINMAFACEVMLFQAARAQLFAEVIKRALADGKVVIADRSPYSSVVYQGVVRGFGKDLIRKLNDVSTQEIYPIKVIYLDVPVEVGLSRRGEDSKKLDRLDMEKVEFHEKVRKAYLELVIENKNGNWVQIDGTQSVDEVEKLLWSELEPLFLS